MSENLLLEKSIFRKIERILVKNKIPFWLESGTLLGLIRNGGNLKDHPNIDIGIVLQQLAKINMIKHDLPFTFKLMKGPDKSGRKWISGDIARLKIKSNFRYFTGETNVNITLKDKVADQYRWVDLKICKSVPHHFFDNLDSFTLRGKSYPIPSRVDQYLRARYGNWKNPNEYWYRGIDDKSIAPDEIIKNIPGQKINPRKLKRKIKLTGSYKRRMIKMIFKTLDILEKYNIPYWLDDGTLLGIVRDGDLIPFDHDADIGIPGEYAEQVIALAPHFLPFYVLSKRVKRTKWYEGKYRACKVKTIREKILKINFHLDLFFKYEQDDVFRWIDCDALKQVDAKYYRKLDKITWHGREVNVPSNTHEYLANNFGDWQTPNRGWDSCRHSGTIMEKGF